jgi:DNA (cytosine-5)-methyltransferase 1
MSITFVDLFSGIGGFHAVGSSLGWTGVYAADIDKHASKIYENNWGLNSYADLTVDASEQHMAVPKHDVLFAGFPCQPFSKGGHQRGMDEARGTLFWNIANIVQKRKPKMVILENVRNLSGPRHLHEWEVIIKTLRDLGYLVSDEPLLSSPHKISPEFGGRPQHRERIYINATYVPPNMRSKQSLVADKLTIENISSNWNPKDWKLIQDLPVEDRLSKDELVKLSMTEAELDWVETWEDFLSQFIQKNKGSILPGFPLWADVWLGNLKLSKEFPEWKLDFIRKNREFYDQNRSFIDVWLRKNNFLEGFPSSRRKFEWQAQDSVSIWDCLVQFRPSGLRIKKLNYVPAAVAITQTPIVGPMKRRLSVREVARLQGLPEHFSFEGQDMKHSYKQLGNGISVASAFHSVLAHIERDADILKKTLPSTLDTLNASHKNPDFLINL